MDGDTRLAEFLRARRELAVPADFGLPAAGRRRVRGLRREEVALLAEISGGNRDHHSSNMSHSRCAMYEF